MTFITIGKVFIGGKEKLASSICKERQIKLRNCCSRMSNRALLCTELIEVLNFAFKI